MVVFAAGSDEFVVDCDGLDDAVEGGFGVRIGSAVWGEDSGLFHAGLPP